MDLDKALKGLRSNHRNILLSLDTGLVLKFQASGHCTDMVPQLQLFAYYSAPIWSEGALNYAGGKSPVVASMGLPAGTQNPAELKKA